MWLQDNTEATGQTVRILGAPLICGDFPSYLTCESLFSSAELGGQHLPTGQDSE